MNQNSLKLCACSLGLAVGIVWGLGLFILGLLGFQFEFGIAIIKSLSSLYLGYGPSLVGSFYGALWGFIDGLIGGFLIGWIYNKVLCCKAKCCKKD